MPIEVIDLTAEDDSEPPILVHAEHNDIFIEPDLVIQLHSDDQSVHYHVSRAILGIFSPVLAKMVDLGSRMSSMKKRKRGQRSIAWSLDLYDDDPDAMLILLRAMHGQEYFVPVNLEFELLLEVVKAADKYDCGDVVKPWSQAWMMGVGQWNEEEAVKDGNEGWLAVCVVLGNSQNFRALMKTLMKETFLRDGEMVRRSTIETSVAIEHLPYRVYGELTLLAR